MVMLLTLGKELYDDFKRYRRDKESNSALYRYLHILYRAIKGNVIQMKTAADIKVGDILEIHAKERIPADIVILSTS